MNKEQIYDEQIAPLMSQIIGICQAHKIALVASFALPTEEDEGLCCATSLPDETGKYPHYLADMNAVIRRTLEGTGIMMMTTTEADGKKTMTAILP